MQRRYHLVLLNLLFLISSNTSNCLPDEITKLLNLITRRRCNTTTRHKYQCCLIQILKKEKEILNYQDDWHKCIAALTIDDNFPILSNNAHIIPEAIDIFYNTPNFLKVTRNLLLNLDNKNSKGYLYEITQALILHKQNHKICAFGIYQTTPIKSYMEREFDLITQTHWYECKSHAKWPRLLSKQGRKLQKQFYEQKQITDDYNTIHNTTIIFEVRSAHQAPPHWQDWFNKHSIIYTLAGE